MNYDYCAGKGDEKCNLFKDFGHRETVQLHRKAIQPTFAYLFRCAVIKFKDLQVCT